MSDYSELIKYINEKDEEIAQLKEQNKDLIEAFNILVDTFDWESYLSYEEQEKVKPMMAKINPTAKEVSR
jgi:hypothetical protein